MRSAFIWLGILSAAFGLENCALAQSVASPARPASDPKVMINYLDPREVMERGGPLMWPILVCSIVTLTFGLERLAALRRRRAVAPAFARRLLEQLKDGRLDAAGAIGVCQLHPSPMASIFAAGLRQRGRPVGEIEHAISEAGAREAVLLRRNLRALSGSGNIATLLGLLGTVLGMIEAFNDVAAHQGLGRAEVLANGIAQALLTTAFGLAVAIPSSFLYAFLAGRVERLLFEMDGWAADLVEWIRADSALSPPAVDPRPPRRAVPKHVS